MKQLFIIKAKCWKVSSPFLTLQECVLYARFQFRYRLCLDCILFFKENNIFIPPRLKIGCHVFLVLSLPLSFVIAYNFNSK